MGTSYSHWHAIALYLGIWVLCYPKFEYYLMIRDGKLLDGYDYERQLFPESLKSFTNRPGLEPFTH
jgi:hypothetical protein